MPKKAAIVTRGFSPERSLPQNLLHLRPTVTGAGDVYAVSQGQEAVSNQAQGEHSDTRGSALNQLLLQLGVAIYITCPSRNWAGLKKTLKLLHGLGIHIGPTVVTNKSERGHEGLPEKTWVTHKDALLDFQLHQSKSCNYIWLLADSLQLVDDCTDEDAHNALYQQWKLVAMGQGPRRGSVSMSPLLRQPRQWDAFHFHYNLSVPFPGVQKLGKVHDEEVEVFVGRLASCTCLAMDLIGVDKILDCLRKKTLDMRAGKSLHQQYRDHLIQAFSSQNVMSLAGQESRLGRAFQSMLVQLASHTQAP